MNVIKRILYTPGGLDLLGYEYTFDGVYFFDIVLPFGLRSSPKIFNYLPDFLEWILRVRARLRFLLHYVDDFIMAGRAGTSQCRYIMLYMTELCERLGVPLASEKTEGPGTVLTFLGIELNTVTQNIGLPDDKMRALQDEFSIWPHILRPSRRAVLSLAGHLGFATKCIPAGRIFLRRILDLAFSVPQLEDVVTLTEDFHADLAWWIEFLPLWNGRCPFLQPEWTPVNSMNLSVDAAGSVGCGEVFGDEFFQLRWPECVSDENPPIAWLEMVPIHVACLIWGPSWTGERLLFITDNQAVATAWAKLTSRHKGMMDLIRRIYFQAALHSFHVRVKYIPGQCNVLADLASRFDNAKLRTLHPTLSPLPLSVPTDLSELLPALRHPSVVPPSYSFKGTPPL